MSADRLWHTYRDAPSRERAPADAAPVDPPFETRRTASDCLDGPPGRRRSAHAADRPAVRPVGLTKRLARLQPGESVTLLPDRLVAAFGAPGSPAFLEAALQAGSRHACDVLFDTGPAGFVRYTKRVAPPPG